MNYSNNSWIGVQFKRETCKYMEVIKRDSKIIYVLNGYLLTLETEKIWIKLSIENVS